MRHVLGIILGIVMAAALFLGGGWGYHRLSVLTNTAAAPHLTGTRGVTSLAALLGTGLLLGILMAVPRISPLAAGLPGIGALAVTALYVTSPSHVLRLIPLRHTAYGLGAHTLLASGEYGLLGLAMIVPLFVPSRWRKRHIDYDEEPIGMTAASSYLA